MNYAEYILEVLTHDFEAIREIEFKIDEEKEKTSDTIYDLRKDIELAENSNASEETILNLEIELDNILAPVYELEGYKRTFETSVIDHYIDFLNEKGMFNEAGIVDSIKFNLVAREKLIRDIRTVIIARKNVVECLQ